MESLVQDCERCIKKGLEERTYAKIRHFLANYSVYRELKNKN